MRLNASVSLSRILTGWELVFFPASDLKLKVKLRSTQLPLSASVSLCGNNMAKVVLDDTQGAVAPGQACVFYDGERVMGGGWIMRED
jgi:tRNA-specific 2-thiouridylase